MARLALADRIIIEEAQEDSLSCQLDKSLFAFSGLCDKGLCGPDNLAWKALSAFRKKRGQPKGPLRMSIVKRIPPAAGLGGGSSDAGAVLRFLNGLWPLEEKELFELALSLGADVPFFLKREALLLAQGLGQILTPWKGPLPPAQVLLVNCGQPLSTARVFAELGLTKGQSRNSLSASSEAGLPEYGSEARLGQNHLLPAALKLLPLLEAVRTKVSSIAEGPWGLSGSGPTFWALYGDKRAAESAAGECAKLGWMALSTWIDF
jgi:4-diphosphocytidyl-2-C-methyl-D-erythritol kinase